MKKAFGYSIDYLMREAEVDVRGPYLVGRNGGGGVSLWDREHGGAIKNGTGGAWMRAVLTAKDIELTGRIDLLAQPRVLGHVFNPVSFWLIHDDAGVLRCVIAEVCNTFGDRHSYLCRSANLAPITKDVPLAADKIFHVSPFQPIEGEYKFHFDITPDTIDVRIDYTRGEGGLIATLYGPRKPLTNAGILRSILRRPFGSRRVVALIHWQAIKLWWKGATFRPWTKPPTDDIT